ncbi:MAG: VWA domain-containing protein, partial [Planctomycetota bacterium]
LLSRRERRLLRRLADRNRIKLYTFSDAPRLIATLRANREKPEAAEAKPEPTDTKKREVLAGVDDVPLQIPATGPATNLERALRRTVESLGGAPIAGVVVLTDGGINQGGSVDDIARYARERKLAVYPVGIGDPSEPRNVRVFDVLAPPNVFRQDPFSITARLSAKGLTGQTVPVMLRERAATGGGEGRVVDTRRVRIPPGGSPPPITFQRRQDRVGRFVYTVEVPEIEGETLLEDNRRQVTVRVIDARTRALIVASTPSWQYRFVTRLLERDETFDVSCWLQAADVNAVRDGNTIIDHLPALPEELFAYDVILLLDPDPRELDEEWCRLLDTFVTEHGGGLLYAAARAHTPALMRDRRLKPLISLLPITPDPEADLVLNEIGYYQLRPSPLLVPETAYGHPVMKMADDPPATRRIWRLLGDVYWHYPVLREKPAATVLLRHGNPRMQNAAGPHVLCAVQYVGAGRTGFLGFDGTWRWRRKDVRYFDRFWVQLTRYLAEGKLLGGSKRGMLLTEGDEYALGETVTVTARLFDRRYQPLRQERVPARVQVDHERSEFVLTPQRDQPGWYEGRFVPDRTGDYLISILVPDPTTNEAVEITREIHVRRPNIEILNPQMNRTGLTRLAQQSAGGEYLEVDQADQLAEKIPDLHEEVPIRSRPTSLWDRGWVLALLLGLLTLEWGVRKWCRLL